MRRAAIPTLPTTTMITAMITVMLATTLTAGAHCQVPCGIYDDEARFHQIEEHITTIEKAINQIVDLGKATPVNYNQVVRWVTTKEDHAQQIQDIVAQYFLAQRIKAPATSDKAKRSTYLEQLELLHGIIVTAMKAKQSTDLDQIEHLRSLVKQLHTSYFKK